MSEVLSTPHDQQSAVLSKAVARVAERWGLRGACLARVLGLSETSASELRVGSYQLAVDSPEWDLGLLLVRAYRALDSIVGEDEVARAWLRSDNRALGGRPIDLLEQAGGLVRVVHYLDASRGRI